MGISPQTLAIANKYTDSKYKNVDAQLAEKANKNSVFTMANMGQDIKEGMTGGSVAVIGNNMANENNLNENCFNFSKHSKKYPLISKTTSKNLFNKFDAIKGYYVDRNTGNLVANASYFTSDFIYVQAGSYIKNNDEQCALYDITKKYLKSGATAQSQIITQSGYIRICGNLNIIDTFQFEKGNVVTSYDDFIENKKQDVSEYFTKKSITDYIESDFFKPEINSKNLFNKETAIKGYYVDRNTGELASNPSYFTSDFIEIVGGELYCKTDANQFALYDLNKKFISPQNSSNLFTTTLNAKFIKLCGEISNIDNYQLKQGNTIGNYEPYGKLVGINQCNFKVKKTIEDIMSKFILSSTNLKIKLIGDSITHGEGGTGYDNLGEDIMTIGSKTWKVNVGGYCWANSLKTYFEQKLNCTVTNYGTSGANSGTIIEGLPQLIKGDEDLIICTIGTNDRHNNTKLTYCNNLKTIYNYCKSRGMEVIFISNIPSSVESETAQPGKWHMEDCDMMVSKISNELNIEYISLYKEFIRYCKYNNVTIDSLLKDGLHPNDAGYDIMYYLICDKLGVPTRREGATWLN